MLQTNTREGKPTFLEHLLCSRDAKSFHSLLLLHTHSDSAKSPHQSQQRQSDLPEVVWAKKSGRTHNDPNWFCKLFFKVSSLVSLFFKLDSTYELWHMIFVFLWLTSLSMIISRSVHVAANDIISFFFMAV